MAVNKHPVGVEDVDGRGDAGRLPFQNMPDDFDGAGVLLSEPSDGVIHGQADFRKEAAVCRERFQTSTVAAPALFSAGLHDDVTDFAGVSATSGEVVAVGDHAHPDAGAEVHGDIVGGGVNRAQLCAAECPLFMHDDRWQVQPVGKDVCRAHSFEPVQVRVEHALAGGGFDQAWNADPDQSAGGVQVVLQGGELPVDPIEQFVGRVSGGKDRLVLFGNVSLESGKADGCGFNIDDDGGHLECRRELIQNLRPPKAFVLNGAFYNQLVLFKLSEEFCHGCGADSEVAGELNAREEFHLTHLPSDRLQVDLTRQAGQSNGSDIFIFFHC